MKTLSVVCLCLVPVALAAKEYPRPNVEYSADITMTMESGGQAISMAGKVFSALDRERREIDMMGQQSVIITRHDSKTTLILMPAQKMYLEQKHGAGGAPGMPGGPDPMRTWQDSDVSMTELGKETINGVATTKYELSMKTPDGAAKGLLWLSADRIPIRFEGSSAPSADKARGGTFRMEAKNLKIGKQPAALFEVPAGFQKFTMPSGGPPR